MGTTFQISDLFGNTPVRKKFLRTRNTELNHIQQAVARYAMAQPGIKFLLITDSRNTLETPGSGRLIETILALYDIETAKNMLELSLEREDISIRGYTANREAHRGSRAEITTLVNGRWIRDSNLAYAVEQAYDKTLPPHRHPISVINIEIPGHLVDSPTSRLMLLSLAEWERETIRDRVRAGVDRAAAEGRTGGRPPALDSEKLRAVRDFLATADRSAWPPGRSG